LSVKAPIPNIRYRNIVTTSGPLFAFIRVIPGSSRASPRYLTPPRRPAAFVFITAQDECRAFLKRTGRIIKLVTVQEILDEEHVQRM
jgi:hypothetical protein